MLGHVVRGVDIIYENKIVTCLCFLEKTKVITQDLETTCGYILGVLTQKIALDQTEVTINHQCLWTKVPLVLLCKLMLYYMTP